MVITIMLIYCISAVLGVVSFFCEWNVVLTVCGIINALALLVRLFTRSISSYVQFVGSVVCLFVLFGLHEEKIISQELSIQTIWAAVCGPTAVVIAFIILSKLFLLFNKALEPLNRRADRIEALENKKDN